MTPEFVSQLEQFNRQMNFFTSLLRFVFFFLLLLILADLTQFPVEQNSRFQIQSGVGIGDLFIRIEKSSPLLTTSQRSKRVTRLQP